MSISNLSQVLAKVGGALASLIKKYNVSKIIFSPTYLILTLLRLYYMI